MPIVQIPVWHHLPMFQRRNRNIGRNAFEKKTGLLEIPQMILHWPAVKIQRPDGKEFEIDGSVRADCGCTVLAEVKKTENRTGVQTDRAFSETQIMPAFFSKGGFTPQAVAGVMKMVPKTR